jgi:hypothetical protein
LGDIGKLTAKARDSDLSPTAYDELVSVCARLCAEESTDRDGRIRKSIDLAGNGRFVRNVIEIAEEERAYRLTESYGSTLSTLDERALMSIELSDVSAALGGILQTLNLQYEPSDSSAFPTLGR